MSFHLLIFNIQIQRRNHTWDLKYVSCGVDSTSADAISRWSRIWRKEGLFLGLQFLQIQDGKDGCGHLQCTVKPIKSLYHRRTPPHASTLHPCFYYSNLLIFCFSFAFFFLTLTVHFQALLTSTAWGGSWSHQGSSRVRVAEGCCFPHPRWWQTSPHLYKGSLQLTSPTAPLRRTLKLSQVLLNQEGHWGQDLSNKRDRNKKIFIQYIIHRDKTRRLLKSLKHWNNKLMILIQRLLFYCSAVH